MVDEVDGRPHRQLVLTASEVSHKFLEGSGIRRRGDAPVTETGAIGLPGRELEAIRYSPKPRPRPSEAIAITGEQFPFMPSKSAGT
jgi:hypothetical protein